MNLAQWIESERKKRDMTLSQFSQFVGVHHQTITSIVNEPDRVTVSLPVLVKLSETTGKGLDKLVAMIRPDLTDIDLRKDHIATQLSDVPEAKLELLKTFLTGIDVEIDLSNGNGDS